MGSENEFDFDNQVVNSIESLRRYAIYYGLRGCDAEDLVNDTILKAYENKDKYHVVEGSGFMGWICTIQRNIFINGYRKKSTYPTDCYDNDMMISLREQKTHSEETDSNSIYIEAIDLIKRSLSDSDYKVIMAFVNGYTYVQISEIFEISLGTIKSKIFNIRQRLIDIINGSKNERRKYS